MATHFLLKASKSIEHQGYRFEHRPLDCVMPRCLVQGVTEEQIRPLLSSQKQVIFRIRPIHVWLRYVFAHSLPHFALYSHILIRPEIGIWHFEMLFFLRRNRNKLNKCYFKETKILIFFGFRILTITWTQDSF